LKSEWDKRLGKHHGDMRREKGEGKREIRGHQPIRWQEVLTGDSAVGGKADGGRFKASQGAAGRGAGG
jgi:hypothetical protein